jgi:hypothetical protein
VRQTSAIPLLLLTGAMALGLGAHHAYAVDLITWGAATNIADASEVQMPALYLALVMSVVAPALLKCERRGIQSI